MMEASRKLTFSLSFALKKTCFVGALRKCVAATRHAKTGRVYARGTKLCLSYIVSQPPKSARYKTMPSFTHHPSHTMIAPPPLAHHVDDLKKPLMTPPSATPQSHRRTSSVASITSEESITRRFGASASREKVTSGAFNDNEGDEGGNRTSNARSKNNVANARAADPVIMAVERDSQQHPEAGMSTGARMREAAAQTKQKREDQKLDSVRKREEKRLAAMREEDQQRAAKLAKDKERMRGKAEAVGGGGGEREGGTRESKGSKGEGRVFQFWQGERTGGGGSHGRRAQRTPEGGGGMEERQQEEVGGGGGWWGLDQGGEAEDSGGGGGGGWWGFGRNELPEESEREEVRARSEEVKREARPSTWEPAGKSVNRIAEDDDGNFVGTA